MADENSKLVYTEEFENEFSTILRCRVPLVGVAVENYSKFLMFLSKFSREKGYETTVWDRCQGSADIDCLEYVKDHKDHNVMMEHIYQQARSIECKRSAVQYYKDKGTNGIIFVIRNPHLFFDDPVFVSWLVNIQSLNSIVNVILTFPYGYKDVVPPGPMPIELEGSRFLVAPLPCRDDYLKAIDDVTGGCASAIEGVVGEMDKVKEQMCEEVVKRRLSLVDVQTALSAMFVTHLGVNVEYFIDRIEHMRR